jgi:hypothetical protein
MGANFANIPGTGHYCFKIHGSIYHRINTLYPHEGQEKRHGQVYILEGDDAVEARMREPEARNCNRQIMHTIGAVLQRCSPYAAAYKHMHEVIKERENNNLPTANVSMIFRRGSDQRRYNEPRHEEVAAIFIADDGAPPIDRDFAVYPREAAPVELSYLSPNTDPMTYPLLFPSGDRGWIHGEEHVAEHRTAVRNKITLLQFYAYRLAERPGFSAIHLGGKLFQQYIVDAYLKAEASRLMFARLNQTALRVEQYQGLMDHLQGAAERRHLQVGRMVILPSTFQGSPRNLQQIFQDAMAIVGKFGKPDIFLTLTCNPRIIDIAGNLKEGQRPMDRVDLIGRVFKQHLQELNSDIRERHVLGKPSAHVQVIEFQKRGLPHCHMLLTLADEAKMRTPEEIDSLICAEIPDRAADPELYELVKSCMVHGPCGALRPHSPCMVEGKCSKGFPKAFTAETSLAFNGYPLYRRRDNGRTIRIGNCDIDNR